MLSSTTLNYTWKVIRRTRVIRNNELESFQDHISSCALRYVDIYIYIMWHILHVLHINNYVILWHVNCQTWQCQLRVWTSSVVIKWFACYLIRLGLTPAYNTMLRALGIYVSYGISHNSPWKMRSKIEVPQENIGDYLPPPTKGRWWKVVPSLLLGDHHFESHFPWKIVTNSLDRS